MRGSHSPLETDVGYCLVGFWGVPNFGDEWLLRAGQGFLREQAPGCALRVLVLSAEAERQLGQHAPEVELIEGYFPDPAFFAGLRRLLEAIRGSNLTLIGGGGLINDSYTALSIPRYVLPALLSTALGTPVAWWGLGVVPPSRPWLRLLAWSVLRQAALVLTRDPRSRDCLAAQGIVAELGEDLSVLDRRDPRAAWHGGATGALVVNFRDVMPDLAAGRQAFVLAMLGRFERVILVAAEPCDEPLYRQLQAGIEQAAPEAAARLEILPALAYAAIQHALRTADRVVSERLHVSLFALGAGVPTTVLSYEAKIDEVIGRLYPKVPILPRARFWRDPAAGSALTATAPGPAAIPATARACTAERLQAARAHRPGLGHRLQAVLWLLLLLPLGAGIALLMTMRRRLRRRLAQERPGNSALAAVGNRLVGIR